MKAKTKILIEHEIKRINAEIDEISNTEISQTNKKALRAFVRKITDLGMDREELEHSLAVIAGFDGVRQVIKNEPLD